MEVFSCFENEMLKSFSLLDRNSTSMNIQEVLFN
jgi:hypothetical protein